jgi:hypothetical protein
MNGRNRAKDEGIAETGVPLTNNRAAMVRGESGEGRMETGGIGRTAMVLTNANAIWDYQKADPANRGSFATDHPNGLCDANEDVSS